MDESRACNPPLPRSSLSLFGSFSHPFCTHSLFAAYHTHVYTVTFLLFFSQLVYLEIDGSSRWGYVILSKLGINNRVSSHRAKRPGIIKRESIQHPRSLCRRSTLKIIKFFRQFDFLTFFKNLKDWKILRRYVKSIFQTQYLDFPQDIFR